MKTTLAFLIVSTLLLQVGPARGAAGWQIRTFPAGEAVRIEESVARGSLFLYGRFIGGNIWETSNAGISGALHGPFPPFPADSITTSAPGGELLVAQRSLWGKLEGGSWSRIAIPDSVGTPTAAAGESPDEFWFGNNRGELYAATRTQDDELVYARIAGFGGTPVASLVPRDAARWIALTADGRFFAQDTAWVEAPVRLSAFDFGDAQTCFGIEAVTARLWRSIDSGLTWEPWSDALADSLYSPYIERVRRFRVGALGTMVLACGDALLVSRDWGVQWRLAATGDGLFEDAAIVDEFDAIVTAGARVHASEDGGYSFEQLMGTDFGDVSPASRSTLWAVDRGLLLSLDQGTRWFRQTLPEPSGELTHILPRGDYEIWLHFESPAGPRTFFSDDRGLSYGARDDEGILRGMRGWGASGDRLFWAWSDSAVMRSSDGGGEWSVVRRTAEGIAAFAARDSLRAAFVGAASFQETDDGGVTWLESSTPGAGVCAIAPAAGERWIAVGGGIDRSDPGGGWTRVFEIASDDTLRSIAMAEDGSGWAVGSSGMIVGTADSGASWQLYRLSLELASVDTLLARVRLLDSEHGVTGAGNRLIRLLPDGSGPVYRIGVSANPLLRNYLDIHVTAHERLRGDSLHVSIDGASIPSEMFDADGYLFRSRYVIPEEGVDQILRVSGRDWFGNERGDSRPLRFVRVGPTGVESIFWGGEFLTLEGSPGEPAALLALDSEAPPLPEGWTAAGAPFQVASRDGLRIEMIAREASIALLENGEWVRHRSSISLSNGSILALLRDPAESASETTALRIFPVPSPGPFRVLWDREAPGAVWWEVFDVAGRRVASGQPAIGSRFWIWDGRGAGGRRIPAGVYWIRANDGARRTSTRFLLTR